jgi:hypothetical protein
MAGTLTITTLSDGTNSTSATNCIQGSAKAWVRFNGGTTPTIASSYNISSITYNLGGDYTINFTSALANANYCITGTCSTFGNTNAGFMCPNRNASTGAYVAPTTTTCRVNTMFLSSTSAGNSDNPVYVLFT